MHQEMENASEKGLEGTGLELPKNRHGNLKSASTDQNLLEILRDIKVSKSPVTHILFSFLLFSLRAHFILYFSSYLSLFCCLQAVINYGASWYSSPFTNACSYTYFFTCFLDL